MDCCLTEHCACPNDPCTHRPCKCCSPPCRCPWSFLPPHSGSSSSPTMQTQHFCCGVLLIFILGVQAGRHGHHWRRPLHSVMTLPLVGNFRGGESVDTRNKWHLLYACKSQSTCSKNSHWRQLQSTPNTTASYTMPSLLFCCFCYLCFVIVVNSYML